MQPRRSVAQWCLCRIESRYWGNEAWGGHGGQPAGSGRHHRNDIAKWSKVIKEAGITAAD